MRRSHLDCGQLGSLAEIGTNICTGFGSVGSPVDPSQLNIARFDTMVGQTAIRRLPSTSRNVPPYMVVHLADMNGMEGMRRQVDPSRRTLHPETLMTPMRATETHLGITVNSPPTCRQILYMTLYTEWAPMLHLIVPLVSLQRHINTPSIQTR